MAQQIINIGAAPNDHTGDTLRVGGSKINANFTELYGGVVRTQRRITTTPTIVSTDSILNCNFTGAITITLPTASTRAGAPLTIKDASGNFATNNCTVTRSGSDTIDGQVSFVMRNNRQAATFYPYNDGSNSGWFMM